MMSIYIKEADDILESDVIKIVNVYNINGIPYGTAVKCVIYSLAGVFALDLLKGISGFYGVFAKKQQLLVVVSLLSRIMSYLYYEMLSYLCCN